MVFVPINGEENTYEIKDTKTNFVDYFTSYKDALAYYNKRLDEYDNLLLLENDKIIKMEYGVVEFDDEMKSYHSETLDQDDYISGSYGKDGAYIDSERDKVYFIVANDKGYIDIDDVNLIPYETLDNVSSYCTRDGYLYHNIKTNLDYPYYSSSLCMDLIPSFMLDNQTYYSYDGHYFYDDFYLMIDDYRNEVYDNAINEVPYYNYYQYLSYRSISNYTSNDINDYLTINLGIEGRLNSYSDLNKDGSNDVINRSELYGSIDEFFVCQYMYGTNAMLLLSSAIVESNYGKSLDCFLSNSLYLNKAYESIHEKENNRYDSVSNSIYTHSKYFINKQYSNYLKNSYCGTFLGDKASGIDSKYTLDHYYGEKVSSAYFNIDKALGFKDYNSTAYGIINSKDSITLYNDRDLSDKLYKIKDINELSFVILAQTDESYLIQTDYCNMQDYLYDYEDYVGYIDIDAFDIVSNIDSVHTYELNKVNYDFDGGTYHGLEEVSFRVNPEDILDIIPSKDGYEFAYYDVVCKEDGTICNLASYRQINSINVTKLFETQGDLLPYPSYKQAKLIVNYTDGDSSSIAFTNDMYSSFDFYETEPQDITISYCGVSMNKQVQLDQELNNYDELIMDAINSGDYGYVKGNIEYLNRQLDLDVLRNIDACLKQDNKRNYVIVDNIGKHSFSFSGLDLSLDDRKNFSLIEDTYYVTINKANVYRENCIRDIASNYGFEVVDSFAIDFKFNYRNIDLRGPVIGSLFIENKDNNYIYSVYHYKEDGDIIKCYSTWSNNCVDFVMYEEGDYVLLKMPSQNIYNIEDTEENLTITNMGSDNNKINIEFLLGLIMILSSLIGIIIYYNVLDRKDKQWRDYKKSLQEVGTVQEEKLKN